MELEDQRRFQVEPVGNYLGEAEAWLSCDRCDWNAEIAEVISLADLNQRADEHTEVCR